MADKASPVREPGACWKGWRQAGEGDGATLYGPQGERLMRLPLSVRGRGARTRRWAAYRPDGTVLRTADGRQRRYLSAVSACFGLGWILDEEAKGRTSPESPSRTS